MNVGILTHGEDGLKSSELRSCTKLTHTQLVLRNSNKARCKLVTYSLVVRPPKLAVEIHYFQKQPPVTEREHMYACTSNSS